MLMLIVFHSTVSVRNVAFTYFLSLSFENNDIGLM